ncbi:uncharacterized protein LOC127813298 isoform X2 [Diospyros lotus]|uniref:uncharacterized protein LOC127813298 isoform X2 n=1 Tax=Diospyros lotus TaxID=55363 RepID=UPI0022566CF2|nr:uncharacterized protein LOC127813298 isoform X2 [Diospyros lotus]
MTICSPGFRSNRRIIVPGVAGPFRAVESRSLVRNHPLMAAEEGIEVAKTATVAELKEAVEQAFSHITRTGPVKISWSHVWGHFCLSYDGWKLVLDSEPISIYGIDHGDQLYFVRHHSTNHNLPKRRSKYRLFALKQPKLPDGTFEREQIDQKDHGSNDQNNSPDQDYDDRNGDIVTLYELKLSQLLGRWFQYQRVGSPASRYQGGPFSSKLANGISGALRSILWLHSSDKLDSRRDPLEEV